MATDTLHAGHSLVKVVGAVAWLVGVFFVFVLPPLGVGILLVAIILSVLSIIWTRQARHDGPIEVSEAGPRAARQAAAPIPPPPPGASTANDGNLFGLHGSGNVITESRNVNGFNEIAVLGSGEVKVDVNGIESLIVEAEDNIVPLLKTEVRNGRLELSVESSISPSIEVRYTITAVTLDAVSVSGSGDVAATGINAGTFDVEITGSGKVEATGIADRMSLGISRSGCYAGEGLVAAVGTVRVSGSGEAVMYVTDDLDIDVSGSGSVEYIGKPSLATSISGSGDISRR
jgi:hypothetical protein